MVGLRGDEIVYVIGVSGNGQQAASVEPTTTADIAHLSGSGGLTQSVTVNTGDTIDAEVGTVYIWNSSTVGPKTMNAPKATGTLDIIEAVDAAGDAGGTGTITFVPNGGDTVIGQQNQLYTDNGSARWRDVAIGLWANI